MKAPSARWNEIVRNALKMVAAQAVQIPLQLVTVLVIPKFIGPTDYGLWRSLLLINQYSPYLQLGTQQAMVKEMPYLAGSGDWETRRIVCSNTFYYVLCANALLGAGLVLASFFTAGPYAGFYAHGFRVFALIVLLTSLFAFYQDYLRIEKEFTWLGILSSLTPAVNVSLSLALLYYSRNVLSLVYALVLANAVGLFLAVRKAGWPLYLQVSLQEIGRLIRVGFPLMLIPILYTLIMGIGQVMILLYLSPEDLGYYSLAISIQGFIYLLPSVLGSTMVPYLFEHFGRTKSAAESAHMFTKPTMAIALFSAYILAGVYLFIHLPVRYFLYEYMPCLPVIYVLLLGLYSMTLIMVAGSFIVICGREKAFLKWQLVILPVSIVLNITVILGGYGIIGVAWAAVVIYLFYSTGILYLAFSLFNEGKGPILKQIGLLYGPLLYLAPVLFAIIYLLPNEQKAFWKNLSMALMQGLLLTMAAVPLFLFTIRRLALSEKETS